MTVFMLRLDGDGTVFYSEGGGESSAPATGLRGRLERASRAIHAALHGAKSGMLAALRRVWLWLQRRIAPDESLLRRLGSAGEVTLVHPAGLDAEAVRATWSEYLRARGLRHGLWLMVNLLISPLTLLLMPLPGPNIIGYWFVYRAACHALAWRGVRRARSGRLPLIFEPSALLDAPLDLDDEDRVSRVALAWGLENLRDFLRQAQPRPGAAPLPTRDDDARAEL
jgi:hypothetical protein